MTIAILKLEPGQTIPRPFSRAINADELVEILVGYLNNTGGSPGPRGIQVGRIDSEQPIYCHYTSRGQTKFFAFREP